MGNRLYRSRDDRMLAGVAGGIAEYFGLDPSLVRIVWAVLFLAGGVGALLYGIAWIVIPEEPEFEADRTQWTAPTSPATGVAAEPGTASAAPDVRAQGQTNRDARRAARRARRDGDGRTASIVIGSILVLLGAGFLVREYLPQIDFDWFWPVILVVLGILVIVAALRPGGPRGTAGPGGPT